jgi:type IV pilus assembly protein PilC
MPHYLYKLKDENGKSLYGFWEATDVRALKLRLSQFGSYFIFAKVFNIQQLKKEKVSFDALLMFTYRLTSLIESGIPILQALNILWRQSEEKTMQLVISRMYRHVEDGENISSALDEFPGIFPFLYRALMHVAEKTGSMVFILRKIVEHLEYQRQFTTRIKKAMMYPLIVMSLTILVLIGMFTFVVPTFQKVLMGLNVELPLLTRIVLSLSEIMRNPFFIVFMILGTISVIIVYTQMRKVPEIGYKLDKFAVSVPFFGNLFLTMSISRFISSLRVLIGSGLPIVESLEVARSTVTNQYLTKYIGDIKEGVKQGRSLYETFQDAKVFPILLVEMLGIGEKVGTVTKILESLAHHFDEEVDYKLNKFLTILDPLLIVTVGTIIIFTMLAIYLPIFSIWNKLAS